MPSPPPTHTEEDSGRAARRPLKAAANTWPGRRRQPAVTFRVDKPAGYGDLFPHPTAVNEKKRPAPAGPALPGEGGKRRPPRAAKSVFAREEKAEGAAGSGPAGLGT